MVAAIKGNKAKELQPIKEGIPIKAIKNSKHRKCPQITGKEKELIGIALCCRGKCSFQTYCNLHYFVEEIRLIQSKKEWNLIRKMTKWGIDRKGDERRNQIGSICRRLMDEGRAQYLRKNGFKNVRFVRYCDASVTKENILMIATET